jgi:hypothetical protein
MASSLCSLPLLGPRNTISSVTLFGRGFGHLPMSSETFISCKLDWEVISVCRFEDSVTYATENSTDVVEAALSDDNESSLLT